MAWSKSTRIRIMLGIDVVFFLVELIAGLVFQSLALTADAFHMLNDIISLCVGLWAVAVARKATTDKYSYGWLRAEILGAFFNAVFLIALCVTIILEAIGRFFDPPEIKNPEIILIVGAFGLASNLVGFLVLGGHGHSHGGDDHDHDHDHDHEHDHVHSHVHSHPDERAAEEGRAVPVDGAAPDTPRRIRFDSEASGSKSQDRRKTSNRHHSRLTSIEDISIHPSSFRQEIIAASRAQLDGQEFSSDSDTENVVEDGEHTEESPLLSSNGNGKSYVIEHPRGRSSHKHTRRESSLHQGHNHNKERKAASGGHGHNHGDMGMNAMVLHVIGDALGNVGVMATALIIWLTDWPGRFYADPAVSLFITLIILKSALPLTKATSKVLLQATPDHIDPNEIREDIENLPGVISCHHIHIWQLSDTKHVASMHVQVSFPISAEGGEKYMELSKRARKCLHAYGIHSATIQPEFCGDEDYPEHENAHRTLQYDGVNTSFGSPKQQCLLECVDDCVGKGCCTESTAAGSVRSNSAHSHDSRSHSHSNGHDHDHGHSH
ncbi:zinc cadmium resistance protein [Colletotrichum sojae]|uniref:Zinc cadmium resistance protein n=1 Tax=Colletotrichum sojae TaxID=2175907 RepID=A0A8H6J307_9PEZI|nr:zinc cadmium resistance protein [Colletotrichum sojae]